MLNRRRFLKSISAAFAAPGLTYGCQSNRVRQPRLRPDHNRILDVMQGFKYQIVSKVGKKMDDGLRVPGAHDGMAAFSGENGKIVLVRNHELSAGSRHAGPYEKSVASLDSTMMPRFYDLGGGKSPGLGGTVTTIYDPNSEKVERQFLSLGGTDINCAGGPTPWGSWLSCEESFAQPGDGISNRNKPVFRDKRHGYVFEVPASSTELVDAVPLKAMGRFEHEAAAVHVPSGVVYMTEDRWYSLFYRFIPNVPGKLHKGGRLQALAIDDRPGTLTHNWLAKDLTLDKPVGVHWIDLEDVDSELNDLRERGAEAGAARFARGEGLTIAGNRILFNCTIGGPDRLGQIFEYIPSKYEGHARECDSPGALKLMAEANHNSIAKNCDNMTMAPWGDLIVCEDTESSWDSCGLVGIRPDGSQYQLASNEYTDSELAGVCFSPDGKTLFVNIQYPGMTLAITGPWPT